MKKTTILLFTIAALASGCKKFTENINTNLNQPTAVTPNVLLSAALVSSASDAVNGYEETAGFQNVNCWMGYWSRSGSYIADNQTEGYGISSTYADGDFQALFGTCSQYNNVEIAGKASPSTLAFYIGVAQVMKAFHFGTLVDAFNNVPYSQAFNITKYPTPKYDDAQTIYTALITQCDSAIGEFELAAAYYKTNPTTQITQDDKYDVMFGRSAGVDPILRMTEWEEFTNTVKLRLLLHESSVTSQASFIQSEISKALPAQGGAGFLPAGTSASINPGYSTAEASQQNPFWNEFYTPGGTSNQNLNFYRANKYATYYLDGTKDSVRNILFYSLYLAPDSVGANYEADPNSASNSLTSTVGTGLLKSASQDQLVISDFESLFLQAEAAQLGYIPGGNATALTYVKQALEQNFVYLGDNATDADVYFGRITAVPTPPLVRDPTKDPTTGLEAIVTQKWAALNGIDWFEAYDDYRRLGFPVKRILGVSLAPNHVTHMGGVYIPFRFFYPQSETDRNGANVPSGVTQYTPVFWDKREQ